MTKTLSYLVIECNARGTGRLSLATQRRAQLICIQSNRKRLFEFRMCHETVVLRRLNLNWERVLGD